MTSGCWKPARRKYGVVVVSYKDSSVPHSLPLQIGETLQIWEEYWIDQSKVTWLRGCVYNNKSKEGIFPASYVHTKECSVENEGQFEIVTPIEDAIIRELTFVLREWNQCWKTLFVKHNPLFQTISQSLLELAKYRSALVPNTLTKEHADKIKNKAVTKIDWGNGQLGMDLVPRVDNQQVEPDRVSVVEMFRIHERSVKNCQDLKPDGKLKNSEKQSRTIYHLQVTLCSFACSVCDNTECLLSLYDNKEGKLLSERFVMYFTPDGKRDVIDKNNSTIFTELSSDDLNKDLYLVVQILRKGRLLTDGNYKKVSSYQYRRPWGVSVLSLRDLLEIESELEYFLRVQCTDNELFASQHESLIRKQTQMTGKVSATDKQNQGITLSLKFLQGDIRTVRIENPVLFSKGVVLTQRMGFSEFINPGEIRNDLYVTLHYAEFERGSKKACKNVEVQVKVYNDQYEQIKECILPASGDAMKNSFHSYVLYHHNSPRWNETVRLSVPIEKFSSSHIRFEFFHCSDQNKAEKKMYGFAYLPVTTKESTTRLDGKYDLCIYRCEDPAKVKSYLCFPSLRDDFNDPVLLPTIPSSIPYLHSNKEYIIVETLLCSSKFTQKTELLNILKWSTNPNPAETVTQSLEQLLKLNGQELVRYLQDILDALFSMLTARINQMIPFAENIFEALVSIFNLLHEEMFENFSVVLEDYLEKSFSSPIAHREIMVCLRIQAERMYTSTDFDENLGKTVFMVLDDILKFSIKSSMLSQRIYGAQSVNEFRDNLSMVFEAFGRVLHSQDRKLQKIQAQLLNSLHKSYIPLMFIISNTELAQLVISLLGKIHQDPGSTVLKAKTSLIRNTINSQLFRDLGSRDMILPLILGHLKKCLIMQHHLELTASTLGDLLTEVYKLKETCDIRDEVTKIIQGVFDVTVRALASLIGNRKKISGNLLVACLIEMLSLMDVSHYQKLMNDYPKPKPLKDFLGRVLMVFRNLVRADSLPVDWFIMRLICNNVMLTAIQYIAEDLTVNFIQGTDFDRELWYSFFQLSVDFITQPALQLENYSEAKSSQIKSRYNDMRVPVGYHISSLWNQLGSNKQHLMMELIGPFLKVTMVPQLELRKATIPIFFDIMQCEHKMKSHLRRVENRMVQDLDWLVLEHNGDAEYKKLFKAILLEKVQAEPELHEEGKRFVFSVTDLLGRLLDYREIMDREDQRDTKMHCTFNILNFYKESRRDMYIRYISRLYELHYSASNYVEAGLTLRLYAQLLSWSQAIQPADMSYTRQTEAERKEELFIQIIECFDKGKAWEYGLPLCKEMAEYYEKSFQYKKLGHILQKQAAFLYQILEGSKLRQDPAYYRVAYFGNTFPPYLKNKAFIYRGDECQKLATIMGQLNTEYPTATILSNNSPPDESLKLGNAQYIQIVSVKPVPSERPEFAGKEVPTAISSFYNTNEVDTFQFDRPYHRDSKDANNEFKSLCLERTIIQTAYKLPGILRWYEVTNTRVIHLGPVQTAMDTVVQMNSELRSSTEKALANPDQFLRHLEMRLQGVISGAVNGGIPKYQEAFFNEEYTAKHPSEAVYIEQLKSVILEQIQLLDKGLDVHGRSASPEMVPLHKSLVDTFIKIKKSMGYQNMPSLGKYRGSSLSLGSGSQRPGTPSSTSQNSSGSNRSSVVSGGEGHYAEDDYMYVEKYLEGPMLSQEHLIEDSSVATPPPPPPRNKSSPELNIPPGLLSSLSLPPSEQAPPIPYRNTSRTSLTMTDANRSMSSVNRSESIKSTNSGEIGSPSPPPRPTRAISTSTSVASYAGEDEDSSLSRPPLPAKRPSISPLTNKALGGSICSHSNLSYNNFNHTQTADAVSNIKEQSDIRTGHVLHPSSRLSQSGAQPSQERQQPLLIPRGSSISEAPLSPNVVPLSLNAEPSPSASRSPLNRDSPVPQFFTSSEMVPLPVSPRTTAQGPPPVPKRTMTTSQPA